MKTTGKNSGFGMLEAIIAVSVAGIFIVAFTRYLAYSAQTNSVFDRKQQVELVRQYVENQFDCEETFKQLNLHPSTCGSPNSYIDGYDFDGNKIATADQRAVLPGKSFGLRISCPKSNKELLIETKRYASDGTGRPAYNALTKEKEDWIDPFHGLSPYVEYATKRPILDFETIPGTHEGFNIVASNAFFKARYGLWFENEQGGSLNLVRVVDENDPIDPAVVGWDSYLCPRIVQTPPLPPYLKHEHHNRLCNGGNAGTWIMSTSSATNTTDITFVVHYLVPVQKLAFDLADLDGTEHYTITAFEDDAHRHALPTTTTPSVIDGGGGYGAGSGNNKLTHVEVSVGKKFMRSIRIHGHKRIAEYGFGFDNFSTGIAPCRGW